MAINATTFDPNNKGASATLSGSNLVATVSSGTATAVATNRISGPTYYEMTVGATLSGSSRVGLANPVFTTTGLLGVDNNGIGYDAGGTVKINNATVATIATYTTTSRIGVAIDPVQKLIWFRVNNGNWNNDVIGNQNPVGSVGGISYATVNTPSNPAWGGTATSSITAAFATGSWVDAAPTGYVSPNTLGLSSEASGDVADRAATFTQYGHAANQTPPTPVQVSAIPANRSAAEVGAWYGNKTRTWSPAATAKTISGNVQELSIAKAGVTVALFDSATFQLLGTAVSDGSGNYPTIAALGKTNVFAVALDPTYQGLIFDQLTPA